MAEKDLTIEQMLSQAAGNLPDPETDPETDPEEGDPETDPEDGEEKPPVKKPQEKEKKPNPMKEVRDRYNTEKQMREKIDTLINKFTLGDYDFKLKDFSVEGKMDYEALEVAMTEADTKAKAEARGVSPEVQAEIDRIEKEKVELAREKLKVSMDKALANLQLDRSIKSADINQFFKDSMAAGKNPYVWLAQGGDLNDLYDTVYKDKIMDARIKTAVEEARVQWQAEMDRKGRAPVPNPGKSLSEKGGEHGDGVPLDKLLQEAANRKHR